MNVQTTHSKKRPFWTSVLAIVGILFGLMTLREGGSVIFIDGAAREAAGNYVEFVVWFNFLAGFAYVLAGIGLWLLRPWAVWLALGIAGATLMTFGVFGLYVLGGGVYEARTVVAMSLRAGVWAVIGIVAYWQVVRDRAGDA